MSATATLTSKFQISIPKAIREQQNWKAGEEFTFIPKGQGVLLMPVPTIKQLADLRCPCRDAAASQILSQPAR